MKAKGFISFLGRVLILLSLLHTFTPIRTVFAYQVAPLPEDNLNPLITRVALPMLGSNDLCHHRQGDLLRRFTTDIDSNRTV